MEYFISKNVNGEFEAVVERVKESLKNIGFGVITTIDMQSALKEKINEDIKPYTILGACSPHFASKAMRLEDKIGVLLPCNVVIIDQGNNNIEVAAMEPHGIIELIGNEQLSVLASDISKRLISMMEAF
ncbi:MAG: hypothetical protein CVT92_03675 [Bacteroidetes bacterium HGW-Bacteroidetes-1]|jgi:uncharacterized protein (DUF302 family)|nr:MAG: hypothetical protein CVT92_03675 [Bacteroidetes bacterium HGW-Bacteroidetes-1]